ncbi:MAG: alpha-amylase family glycosyl hydrolase [Aminobacteriaceae bacterium]
MNDSDARIGALLAQLYGEDAVGVHQRLERLTASYRGRIPAPTVRKPIPSERDTILITYADQFSTPGEHPLRTLRSFMDEHLAGHISGVHILPCFPYSSDDGFSVVDYRLIDPELGEWEDIAELGERYRLMLDFVANHVSRESEWFAAFTRGEEPWSDFFITVPEGEDLSKVVRPRTLPLLTRVDIAKGERLVWTTFSDDQIDLNYASPDVLLEMTDILLHYALKGAEIVRLDAIAYLWKTPGTSCIHLPQTHAVIKLWRAVLDDVAPHVMLITETNVPHEENISYFGDPRSDGQGTDEAQIVYNFSLAPLTLHALLTGDASVLSGWASGLRVPTRGSCFFNFIASHDGIGVTPAKDILSDAQIAALAERTLSNGGRVSHRANPDGSVSPYELNITLYDFLNDPSNPDPTTDEARFIASQTILLSLAGVPGIYVHSLFGTRSSPESFARTGRARSLNRRKFTLSELEEMLADPILHHGHVFDKTKHLLATRAGERAFHPYGEQRVVGLGNSVFALLRTPPDEARPVLCLQNVSAEEACTAITPGHLPGLRTSCLDLLSGERFSVESGKAKVPLAPYQGRWLTV